MSAIGSRVGIPPAKRQGPGKVKDNVPFCGRWTSQCLPYSNTALGSSDEPFCIVNGMRAQGRVQLRGLAVEGGRREGEGRGEEGEGDNKGLEKHSEVFSRRLTPEADFHNYWEVVNRCGMRCSVGNVKSEKSTFFFVGEMCCLLFFGLYELGMSICVWRESGEDARLRLQASCFSNRI